MHAGIVLKSVVFSKMSVAYQFVVSQLGNTICRYCTHLTIAYSVEYRALFSSVAGDTGNSPLLTTSSSSSFLPAIAR